MKNTLTREHYIPKGAVLSIDHPDAQVYIYDTNRKGRRYPAALCFVGKAQKPAWHNLFSHQTDIVLKATKTIEGVIAHRNRLAERKIERTQPSTLKVGDILYTSWGYDQTNIDFYQVTATIGDRTVKARAIGSKIDHSDTYSDYMVADKDRFVGKEATYRVKYGNRIKIASYADAYLWDGKPKYQTNPMFGH